MNLPLPALIARFNQEIWSFHQNSFAGLIGSRIALVLNVSDAGNLGPSFFFVCLFSGVGCFLSALILLLRAQLGYRKYELEFLITSACGISNAVLLVLPGISDAICDLYDNKQE